MRGKVFDTLHCGRIVVHEYVNYKEIKVTFLDTGHALTTTKRVLLGPSKPRLRDPLAKTVFGRGCIGIGSHKAHVKQTDTKSFSIWREGCTVAEEWLNFQAFAQWYEDNYPKDGARYQLDKDTILKNNKQYGPSTCRFVTQLENLAARRFKRDRS